MGKKWEKKQKPNSQKFFAGSGGFSSKLSIIPWNGKIDQNVIFFSNENKAH